MKNVGLIFASTFEYTIMRICSTSKPISTTSARKWLSIEKRIIHDYVMTRREKIIAWTTRNPNEVVGIIQLTPIPVSTGIKVGKRSIMMNISKKASTFFLIPSRRNRA